MKEQLEALKHQFVAELDKIKSLADLKKLENKFLSRKNGLLTQSIKGLKSLPKDQIALAGRSANEVKNFIINLLDESKDQFSQKSEGGNFFDYTLPGKDKEVGHLHPVSQAIREISGILEKIGFQRTCYPEVEWDYYSFESLNMPPDHPARDAWETFFIDRRPINQKYGQRVLTPHTSSAQVREMEKGKLPIRMTNISKCYRRQIDVSHVPMFYQFEGLVIDREINLIHLKGTIEYFVKKFFGLDRVFRLRPHHFSFTEPSFEIDISCGLCHGRGCKLCKEGWLELGGAGMVHPNVLKFGKIDPKKYSGFAFGWGVERCYLMKADLNLDDIRLIYKNDLRFIKQF